MQFYAVQIIDAVKYLHKSKMAHRDLTLKNILVDKNGYLKIIGFGVSKKFESGKLTTQSICGSL